ncbi:MAG: hypothetical protein QOF30_1887 [Acidimicrobiaceae bacterium]|nr:hypothetical protein [Acidimicrobiaceae bacterium]
MVSPSPGWAEAGDAVMLGVEWGPAVTFSVWVVAIVVSPQRRPMVYEPTGVDAGIMKVARKLPLASRGTIGPNPLVKRFVPGCAGAEVSCTAAPEGQTVLTDTFPEIVIVPPCGADKAVAVISDPADAADGADAADAAAVQSPGANKAAASNPAIRADVRPLAGDRPMPVASSSRRETPVVSPDTFVPALAGGADHPRRYQARLTT